MEVAIALFIFIVTLVCVYMFIKLIFKLIKRLYLYISRKPIEEVELTEEEIDDFTEIEIQCRLNGVSLCGADELFYDIAKDAIGSCLYGGSVNDGFYGHRFL